MEWLLRVAGRDPSGFSFWEPATERELAATEVELGRRITPRYREFLLFSNGGILWHGPDASAGGLHLFGTRPGIHGASLVAATENHWSIYERNMRGLTVIGHTPGAGGFYIAMNGRGQIVDLFGLPNRYPTNQSLFPAYRGEWRIIASSLKNLVERMALDAVGGGSPFYWFRV